jgi:ubiquinol-cytochrome c reductase iron-sulfur subunit
MSEDGTEPTGPTDAVVNHPGTAVSLDQGNIKGSGGIPERFTNPGPAAHVHRLADHDEGAARRAERQVATLFGLSMVATIAFLVAYFAIDLHTYAFVPGIGQANLSNIVLGVSLGVSLLCIGLGAIHWAKTLMPDTEIAEDRHPQRSSEESRAEAAGTILAGGKASQLARRPLIKYTLGGALGLFALPLVVQLAGSLGPLPKADLSTTFWRRGIRLMHYPEFTPIKASEVTIGSVFHVMPDGVQKTADPLEQEGKAAVLLMRLDPSDILSAKERDWGHDGIVAYSMICTHVGCPVGLYEHQTHHLLCPCHQSTFDVTQDAKVIFGPANRPLPQLKITVDADDYLVADAPFLEPVGPSFWERG